MFYLVQDVVCLVPPRAAPAQRQPQGYMDDITNGFRNANIGEWAEVFFNIS